jgi:hypothetical protein
MQPIKPFLDPISTDFEGGNTRDRARPGDNVGTLTQTIEMSKAEFATLDDWIKNTVKRGRFTMMIWTAAGYVSKVCQFHQSVPTNLPMSASHVAVTMTLRVFDY